MTTADVIKSLISLGQIWNNASNKHKDTVDCF